jgi:3-dehydroquinate dehydratase
MYGELCLSRHRLRLDRLYSHTHSVDSVLRQVHEYAVAGNPGPSTREALQLRFVNCIFLHLSNLMVRVRIRREVLSAYAQVGLSGSGALEYRPLGVHPVVMTKVTTNALS